MARSADSADSSVLKAFKLATNSERSATDRERAQKLAEKAALEIKDDGLRAAFTKSFEYFRQQKRLAEIGQSGEPPIDAVLLLGRFGMVRSAEFAATQLSKTLREPPLQELLAAAPSTRFIDSFAKKQRGLATTILEMIAQERALADQSAAFDWFVKHAKPTEIAKVAPLLGSNRERLPHLARYAALLSIALKRDKGGLVLDSLLKASAADTAIRTRIGAAFADDPKLMVQLLKSMPKLLSGEHHDFALQLLHSWLPRYPRLPMRVREPLSSALAGLAVTFLKKSKRKPQEDQMLDLLSRSMADSLSTVIESRDLDRFWVFARANELAQSLSTGAQVSPIAARLITSSMEKAASGTPAGSLLEALALNVGMTQLAKPGEKTTFNPDLHEDLSGGLLPNDAALVRTSGWALEGKAVQRAGVVAV